MNSTKKQRIAMMAMLMLMCIALVAAAIFGWLWYQTDQALDTFLQGSALYDHAKLAEILTLLQTHSIYDLPQKDKLTDTLISALLGEVGDPYAAYFNTEDFQAWTASLAGNFCGIGVAVGEADSQAGLEVYDVFPGSPAEAGGVLVGDIIVAVDDHVYTTNTYATFVAAIAGEKGSAVNVTVMRGAESITLSLVRDEVVNRTILYETINEGGNSIGYIRITGFDGNTFAQFKAAVDTLEGQNVSALIFDLRNNGGGTLYSVSQMLAYLLPDGVIAYVDYASEQLEDYSIAQEGGLLHFGTATYAFEEGKHQTTCPMAVLVNQNTASAAELFTAALRDYARRENSDVLASIFGEVTYGKGTMQNTYDFTDHSGMKFTVAHYNPPSNVNYDGVGIEPDVIVSLPEAYQNVNIFKLPRAQDSQLKAALSYLTQPENN